LAVPEVSYARWLTLVVADGIHVALSFVLAARDASLRARLGKAGRGKLEREFALKACLDAHEALYGRLLVD
jgi:hypothetical protein